MLADNLMWWRLKAIFAHKVHKLQQRKAQHSQPQIILSQERLRILILRKLIPQIKDLVQVMRINTFLVYTLNVKMAMQLKHKKYQRLFLQAVITKQWHKKVIFMLKVPKLCLRVKTNYLQRVMLFQIQRLPHKKQRSNVKATQQVRLLFQILNASMVITVLVLTKMVTLLTMKKRNQRAQVIRQKYMLVKIIVKHRQKFYQKIKLLLMHKILLWIQLLIPININKVKVI